MAGLMTQFYHRMWHKNSNWTA